MDMGTQILELAIGKIEPNPWNRIEFDVEGLKELAASIEAVGVLVPILVRPMKDKFQLIAGERRWKASRMIKKSTIPAIVRDLSDVEAQQEALIENIQREDIDPITEAQGYERLVKEFKVPQQEVAKRVGKSKGYISTQLNFLLLPKEIWSEFSRENFSRGHGVQLLRLGDPRKQRQFTRQIVARGLSVVETQRRVDRVLGGGRKVSVLKKPDQPKPPRHFPFKLEGLKDGVKLLGKTPLFYELMIPIKWHETDLEAVLVRLLETVRVQRQAWAPIKGYDAKRTSAPKAVKAATDSMDRITQAAEAAVKKGLSGDAALRATLEAAFPGTPITEEMIQNLKKNYGE